ncbi:PRD domain-containing protein [Clostridiales bacterium COT073_COT-073]|nr:PRD domain-containing protein [Clostridiales bacterium COT073_COT-073]
MQLNERLRALLLCLSENEYIHQEIIAQKLELSPRTIRTLMHQLKDLLEQNGATVQSRRNYGVCLIVHDQRAYQKLIAQELLPAFPETSKQRKTYILSYLFENCNSYIKADHLCELLYISRKTLSNDLKSIEQYLQKYQIHLERKPYYGMKLTGSELNFRICLHNMFHSLPSKWLQKISIRFFDFALIHKCIIQNTMKCDYNLYETDIDNIVMQIQIALYRIKKKCIILSAEIDYIPLLQENDIHTAQVISSDLEYYFNIKFPDQEIQYLALLLLSKKKSSFYTYNLNSVHSEIHPLVHHMLESIDHTFQLNFQSDSDLNTLLVQHMISLYTRLKYNLKLDNPILEEIKETYSFAYAIAAHASTVLAEYFKTIVPEEEIGYLALCFALALKRKASYSSKRNILLVCASGIGSAKLFEYRFRELFNDYINQIFTCDVHTLDTIDFSHIDYVFSTVPVPIALPVPVCQVQYFFDKHNIADVERILKNKPQTEIKNYFSQELFFTDIKGDSREEVLKSICQRIGAIKNLPPDFEEYVLKREQLMQTDFCPYVAIPHPYKPITNDTFVCVAVLEKPIFWNMYDVQVIFLLSISTQKENLEDFYNTATKFMMDEVYIKELIHKKDFNTLIRIICEVEQK